MLSSDCTFIGLAKAAYERISTNSSKDAEADHKLLRRHADAKKAMDIMMASRGTRYRDATFDNYVVKCDAQQKVVDKLREYATDSVDRIASGQNVLLIGPKGCGKDHLLMALSKEVFCVCGKFTHWENGIDLFEDIRQCQFSNKERRTRYSPVMDMDDIDKLNRNGGLLGLFEEKVPLEKTAPILWVSDPLPPSGPLSEFQQSAWLSIIDRRYSQKLPTWVSLNVADGDECERRMGAQSTDRLRDDALVLFCNWESHRQATK